MTIAERPRVKDWLKVVVFDGRGGVRQLDQVEESAFAPPTEGFVLISGNPRAPELKPWLVEKVGEFAASLILSTTVRSRCTIVDDKALVSLRVGKPGADPDDPGKQLLSLWLEQSKVIIVSELNIVELLGIAQWQQTHHAPVSPADLVARLAMRASDRLEPLIERLGDTLDAIEAVTMKGADETSRARLAGLRRTLIGMRRLIWPQRDALSTLEIEELSFLSDRDRVRLREAASRTARLGEELQALGERAALMHEQVLDARSEQMNRTILVLTAVTVIAMPMTVVSGLLGMNVAGIPFAQNPEAFWFVVLGLAVVGTALVLFMRRRKWL